MTRLFQTTAMLGLLALIAAPAVASAAKPVVINKVRQDTSSKQNEIRTARAAVQKTRDGQAALEHRITALKRLAASDRLANRGELERLLEASIAADETLRTHQRDARRAEQKLKRWAVRSVRRIDAEVKTRLPAIKRGSIDSRTKAAKRIRALMALRSELTSVLSGVDREHRTKDWSKYIDVKILADDGPAELGEKADFVEDTRDKFQKKRRAIRRMLEAAKRDREIRRAANEVRVDINLFDEESVAVRVPRTGSGGGGAETTLSAPRQAGVNQRAESPPNSPQATPPRENVTFTDDRTDTTADPGVTLSGDKTAVTDATGGQTTGSGVATPLPGPQSPRTANTIDAQTIINLRIADLDNQKLAPEALEKLLAELAELDAHLARQAKAIRTRAHDLEADEARALEKK